MQTGIVAIVNRMGGYHAVHPITGAMYAYWGQSECDDCSHWLAQE